MTSPRLEAYIDDTKLPEGEARALWQRFSEHMSQHQGDLGGFARLEGLASVHPETRGGRAVLVGSRTAPQRAYVKPPTR